MLEFPVVSFFVFKKKRLRWTERLESKLRTTVAGHSSTALSCSAVFIVRSSGDTYTCRNLQARARPRTNFNAWRAVYLSLYFPMCRRSAQPAAAHTRALRGHRQCPPSCAPLPAETGHVSPGTRAPARALRGASARAWRLRART